MTFEIQELRPYWQDLPRNHPYRIEMEKWNKPWRFEPYPKMMYKARKRPDGIVAVLETNDAVCCERGAVIFPGIAEQWSRGNYVEVRSEDEEKRMYGAGWRGTQQEALDLFHKGEHDLAVLAAHRNYEDRNMSEAAKAEAATYEGTSSEHSPEIPVARKRGRPRKERPIE